MSDLSERISIIIQAVDDTKGAFIKAVKDITGLGEASKQASKGVDQVEAALSGAAAAYSKTEKEVKGTIQATKEMWAACDKAAKSVKETGKALDATAKQADEAGKNMEKAAKGTGGLASAISGAVGAVSSLAAAFSTLGLPVVEAATFERKMKEVGAISEATESQMVALTETARQMGRDTEYSAQQAAEGLKLLAAGGFNAEQAIAGLPGVLNLAMTEGMGLGEAADYAASIIGGMKLKVQDLDHVVDVLAQTSADSASSVTQLAEALSYAAPTAAAVGMDINQTAAALGVLHNAGIKASSAGTGLRGVLTALIDPTKEGANALRAMGVEIAKNSDGSINFAETFGRLNRANMDLAQATQIFNKLNAGSALIFANSLDKLSESTERNTSSQGRAAKMAADFNASTVGAWRNFQSAASDAAIEIGNKMLPAITGVLKAMTTLMGWVGKAAEEFPTLTKVVASLIAVITGFVTVSGTAKVVMAGLEMATAGMGAKMLSLVGIISKVAMALKALALSNPILAAITVAIAAGAAAWAIFGQSSLEASEKHAAAAAALDKARLAAEAEVKSLNDLRDSLLTTKQGTADHAAAEEKLAQIVPGVNTALDERGRVLGTVSGALDENIAKLDSYIGLKKQEAELNTAMQLQEVANAYLTASKGIEEYKNNLQSWYGIGQETQNLFQEGVLWLNKLTGTYQKNIEEGSNMRANLDKQKEAFQGFLAKLAGSGATFEQVNKMLNDIHLDEETKTKILNDYQTMLTSMAQKAADAAANTKTANTTSMNDTAKFTAEQIEAMKTKWEGYAEKVKSLTEEIAGAQRSLSDELRGMAQSGMTDIQAWQDRKAQAQEYFTAAKTAIEEANAAKAAGNEGLYDQKMEQAKQLIIESKDAYKSLNEEVKSNGQVVITHQEGLKVAMQGVKEAGDALLQVMKDQRTTAAEGMKELEKKVDFSALTAGVDEVKLKWIAGWEEMAAKANEQIKAVDMALDAVAKKERWATIYVKDGKAETVTGAGSTVNGVSNYQVGGQAGYPRRAGRLPGWGGGDRIRALLEAGEFIVRKEAVRKYGVGLFHALNGMTMNMGSVIKAQVGGLIPRLPSTQPIRMRNGGAVGGAAKPSEVVELRFSGGSLYGDRGSVDSLLAQLKEAELSA